jgi:hypothetical protein
MTCFVVHIDTEALEEDGHEPTDREVEAALGDTLRYLHKGGPAEGWRITDVRVMH